ncbi:hypothetical protein [Glycomyces xiaoerkulensis]|uniref:hypothetical protein n=1 Tax=Glycomyces xiaoerkulensis TaxID=2038139 RepID=UPI001E480007|nr:hypothetical protein [Glycomyces xiaoerkulensis]
MARGISMALTARRAAALAVAAAATVGLSACGAGQVTHTDTKQAAIAGVNVDHGDIALRDLQVEFSSADGYEAGGEAPLRIWIGNEGQEPVSLESVVTDGAQAVAFCPGDEAASGCTADFAPIEIASEDYVRLDSNVDGADYLRLEGLAEPLVSGQAIGVTFVFSGGREVPVDVPVGQATEQEEPEYEEHPGLGH